MRVLYHYPLCPFSRKIRLCLQEKKLDFSPEIEDFWQERPEFLRLNPLGQVPVFIDLNGSEIIDSGAICEYLESVYPEKNLLGEDFVHSAEIRRLSNWFDYTVGHQITWVFLEEKLLKRFKKTPGLASGPDTVLLRQAKSRLGFHLDYIGWLTQRRNWLAGDDFSLADITAAAHLSVLDYFNEIDWAKFELTKEWYMRIKSRPSFKLLLKDTIAGLAPATHYSLLDF
jgi:glutathione S-transferase